MTVTFATKCWEKDWKQMLAGGFDRKVATIGYKFTDKFVVINNGVPEGIKFTPFAAVDVNDDELKEIFGLTEINHYASGELTAIDEAVTEYLCYVQGDCLTEGGDWVTPGVKVLESEPNVMVVSPGSEVNTWHDKDGYDHYMSDQAWLVRVKDFRTPDVYQVEGVDPDYPSYGGNSFEHMVGKYLKQSGRTRKILPEFWTIHGVS